MESHLTRWGMRALHKHKKVSLVSKNFLESALLPSNHHRRGPNHDQDMGDGRAKGTDKNEIPYLRPGLLESSSGSCRVGYWEQNRAPVAYDPGNRSLRHIGPQNPHDLEPTDFRTSAGDQLASWLLSVCGPKRKLIPATKIQSCL